MSDDEVDRRDHFDAADASGVPPALSRVNESCERMSGGTPNAVVFVIRLISIVRSQDLRLQTGPPPLPNEHGVCRVSIFKVTWTVHRRPPIEGGLPGPSPVIVATVGTSFLSSTDCLSFARELSS